MAVLLVASGPALASDWYPIAPGTRWIYSSPSAGIVSAIVETEEPFAGSGTRALRWNSGATEHLSEDASGRVLSHGLTNPDGSYLVFTPPVVRMQSALFVGQEWESVATLIHYSADHEVTGLEETISSYRVVETAEISVPAGTFSTFEIERVEETGPIGTAALSADAPDHVQPTPAGTAARRFRFTFRESYAEGIGWVRRTGEGGVGIQFRLEAFGVNGVRATASTLSALKASFRD